MTWLRLEDSFHSDPRILKLARILGCPRAMARGYVSGLYSWALLHAADGNLAELDDIDLSVAADFEDGSDSGLREALLKVGILVANEHNEPCIDDWDRLAEGLKIAERQRERRAKKRENTQLTQSVKRISHASEAQPKRDGNATEHGDRRGEEQRGEERSREENHVELGSTAGEGQIVLVPEVVAKPEPKPDPVAQVWSRYREHHPRAPEAVPPVAKKLISVRLREGWTASQLEEAIDGYHRSPWHTGQNPDGKKYLGIDLILRDSAKVQAGIEMLEAADSPLSTLSKTEKRNLQASQTWLMRHSEGDE